MSDPRTWKQRVVHWAAVEEGSTRTLGLLRVVVPLVMWVAASDKLLVWRQLPGGLGRGSAEWTEGLVTLGLAVPFYACTALMCVGLYARLFSALSALSLFLFVALPGWLFGQHQWAHHYMELQIFTALLLALGPCDRSFSIDRARACRSARERGDPLPDERGPLTAQRLLGVLLSTMYFWAAVDKMRAPFVSGEELGRLVLYYYADSDWPAWAGFETLMVALSVGTIALELALAFGLWFARTRVPLIALGVGFHVAIYFSLQVYTFSASTVLLYLVVLPPERVHDALGRWLSVPATPSGATPSGT